MSLPRIVPLCLLILVGCNGRSPTAPTPPVVVPVIPVVGGQWSGSYTVTNCQEGGAAIGSGFCQTLTGGGLVLTPQQSGSSLTGTIGIGGYLPVPIAGSVGVDNIVGLQGGGPIQFDATLALNSFRGTLAGNTLNGTMSFTLTTPSPVGTANVTAGFALIR